MIYDVLQYIHDKNIPGLLLLIDFEKAFDSISWKFLFDALLFSTLDLTLSGGYLCFTTRQNSVLYKMVFFLNFLKLAEVADKAILFHLIYLIYVLKLWDI